MKLEGEFVWHHHDDEDELFLVVAGNLRIELRDGDLVIEPGQFVVIPRVSNTGPSPTASSRSC